MKIIEKQILIERDMDTVFALFAIDEKTIKLVNPNVFEIEFEKKTEKIIGTKYNTKTSINGKVIETHNEVIAYKNENLRKYFETKSLVPKKMETIRQVELTAFEDDKNRTLLKVTLKNEPISLFNKVAAVTPLLDKADEKLGFWLEDIKRVAESNL